MVLSFLIDIKISNPFRQADYVIELNRLLERNIERSHVLDLESLCIRAGEKVWMIRVDLNVLNHDGNVLDCSNLAIICSLVNFKYGSIKFFYFCTDPKKSYLI